MHECTGWEMHAGRFPLAQPGWLNGLSDANDRGMLGVTEEEGVLCDGILLLSAWAACF